MSEDDARILIEIIEHLCSEIAEEQGIGRPSVEVVVPWCLDPEFDGERLAAYQRVKKALESAQ